MTKKQSYPEDTAAGLVKTDNLSIWIEGVENLEDYIENELRNSRIEIERMERTKMSFRTKNVKGKKYWYHWVDYTWKYMGSSDPRPEIEKKIQNLRDKLKEKEKRLRSAQIARFGSHLLVNTKIIVPRMHADDMIKVGEVIRAVRKIPRDVRITGVNKKRGKT